MPLRWDPLLVRHLARELDGRLAGGRVRALRLDGASRQMALLLREGTLAWSLHPDGGAPLLLPPVEPADGDHPFPGRIREARAPDDERTLTFQILPTRGRGARDLVVELLGNQWNALVVERPSGVIRHVLVRRDGPRPARVGLPYAPPPLSAREGASAPLTLERWLDILEPVPPPQRRRELVARVAWTSPLNAGALVEGAEEGAGAQAAEEVTAPDALRAGYRLWSRWVWGEAPPAPALVDTPWGRHPYPWPIPGREFQPASSLLEALEGWRAEESQGAGGHAEGALPPVLIAALEAAVDHRHRRVTRLQAEWDALEDAGDLRGLGDLLLARFREVPQGVSSVTLQDFDGTSAKVTLDPARSVQENAKAFYDRAARVDRARARLPALMEKAAAEAERLEALLGEARRGATDPATIRAALPQEARRGGGDAAPAGPYRTFRTSGGLEARVGRGAKHNDDLTFRHSAPDDVWLHARHTAGAHVILRWRGPGNPPGRDLEEAAALAALHSKARTSAAVAVDWTLRKYVRKPRGAAPGAVVPQRVKTVMVRPDATLLDRLAVE